MKPFLRSSKHLKTHKLTKFRPKRQKNTKKSYFFGPKFGPFLLLLMNYNTKNRYPAEMMPHEIVESTLSHAFRAQMTSVQFLITPLDPAGRCRYAVQQAQRINLSFTPKTILVLIISSNKIKKKNFNNFFKIF